MKPLVTPKFFSAHELVPESLYQERGDDCYRFMNPNLLLTADILRDNFGPMFVNTYKLGINVVQAFGLRNESGLRIPGQKHFKLTSDHSRGNAIDAVFANVSAQEVRAKIISREIQFNWPVVIECTMNGEEISWLHIATPNVAGPVVELHL